MNPADRDAALFSLKCFAAAMLAYYVALRIGLTRPYWAVTTSYIVAQPLAGAVLSKAAFRLVGTFVGASAAVVLVPSFVNEPWVLSLALGLWLGLCLYISLLDRTPRAYVFLLAGYTASIIGFPSVDTPGAIFDTAILRVQEISIGILAGSLIHGTIFPKTVTARLFARVDAILLDSERWSRDALAGGRNPCLDRERRRLALDINELHQLSIHLPFDTSRFLPRVRTVRALQDQLSILLPLASTVEDRIAELGRSGGRRPSPEVLDLVERVRLWLGEGVMREDRDASAEVLIAQAAALEPALDGKGVSWADMLRLNLLSRLAELVATHRDARDLRDQLHAPTARPINPRIEQLRTGAGSRPLHLDRGMAVRSAFGTIATILIGSAIWIITGWTEGAGAVLIAGVCCALFGSADQPGRKIIQFLIGTAIGLAIAAVYAYAILPRATDFVTVAAVLAPALLLLGSMLARPSLNLITLGTLLGFLNTVGLSASYSADFAAFLNGGLGQLAGTGFAVVTVALFQTIGAEQGAHRLIRAAWLDVARRASGLSTDRNRWMSRMLDRIGLLAPRLAAEPGDPSKPLLDTLVDMRIGIVSGDLGRLADQATPDERASIAETLEGIGRHYRTLRPSAPTPPDPAILSGIDRSAAAFARDPEPVRRREGLLLLTSLRRNLFPAAPAFGSAAA